MLEAADDSGLVTEDILKSFYPLAALYPDELSLLAETTPKVCARKGRTLVEWGESDQQAFYLLKGKFLLIPEDGHSYIIEAGTDKARHPISHLDPHKYTIKCLTYVEFFRVANHVIDNLISTGCSGEQVENMDFSDSALNSRVFRDIYADIQTGNLHIPTLPKIAMEIQRAIRDDVSLGNLELMLQADAALAAVLLRTANSPLYRVGQPVLTLEQAILRLGLNMVRNLVLHHCLLNVYKSQVPHIHQLMKYAWTHSAEVAALSYVVALETGRFNPEQALLMGLMHDIGMVPILMYAENYPELVQFPEQVEELVQTLHGDVGAAVLSKWDFPDEFITVAREADDWLRDPGPQADYCDVVLVAQLHAFIGQKKEKVKALVGGDLVSLNQVPAFNKLGLTEYSPEHGITILANANHRLAPVKQLLGIQ
ncbi:MAG: HDOD domain-containing protein [Gammaproteobacteria bacterium]|nr:HDOD domain-containing protein [Gammaproteobacteria bacterium]MDH5801410.1 HDOD domain-containing protein [Gammaproteobacteria bacterium]